MLRLVAAMIVAATVTGTKHTASIGVLGEFRFDEGQNTTAGKVCLRCFQYPSGWGCGWTAKKTGSSTPDWFYTGSKYNGDGATAEIEEFSSSITYTYKTCAAATTTQGTTGTGQAVSLRGCTSCCTISGTTANWNGHCKGQKAGTTVSDETVDVQ